MKPTWCGLLLAASLAGGCVSLDLNLLAKKPEAPAPTPKPAAAIKPPKPVQPEQINESNAHEKANALMKEIEGER